MAKIKSLMAHIRQKPYLSAACLSVLICLFTEALSRHNPLAGFAFLFTHPLMFVYNAAIIFLLMSLSFFFKKKYAVQTLVSLVWLTLAFTNFVLMFFRTTPFSFVDFMLLGYAVQLADIYLNKFEIAMIILLLLGVLAAVIIAFVRAKSCELPKKPYRSAAVSAVTLAVLLVLSPLIGKADYGGIANAYDKLGFSYCFTRSVFDIGIDKPVKYEENTVDDIMSAIPDAAPAPDELPNVIFVQLESFFDVNYIKGLNFSENPIPNFTSLKDDFSHGFLSMPSIGAGTANSEFEVLTGMNLDFFGFNEYPYKTVLQTDTCESMAYSLKAAGAASAVAIHNNTATFYDRHKVFANLGFDRFISTEFMDEIEYNQMGWAKDSVLIPQIEKALDCTSGSDFIYAITVQSHGKYPDEEAGFEDSVISVFSDTDPQNELMSFEYYTNQIHQVDEFIGSLIETLDARGEKTIVVFFGDHLPNLDITAEDLTNEDLYQTEYVIWNNCGLDFEGGDAEAYELSAKVLGVIGAQDGIITRFHLYSDGSLDDLKTLEYDMLYGDYVCYGGSPKYEPTDLLLGYGEQYIDAIENRGDFTIIHGGNFNLSSAVLINDRVEDTLLYSDDSLIILTGDFDESDSICVAQVASDGTVLWQTPYFKQ